MWFVSSAAGATLLSCRQRGAGSAAHGFHCRTGAQRRQRSRGFRSRREHPRWRIGHRDRLERSFSLGSPASRKPRTLPVESGVSAVDGERCFYRRRRAGKTRLRAHAHRGRRGAARQFFGERGRVAEFRERPAGRAAKSSCGERLHRQRPDEPTWLQRRGAGDEGRDGSIGRRWKIRLHSRTG